MTGNEWRKGELLDLDLGSGCLDLLFDLLSLFLGGSLLDGLGSTLNKCLGLRETESGDCCADLLDDADLIGSGLLEDYVKGGLFLGSGCGSSAGGGATCGGHGNGSCGANAPLLFKGFYEIGDLKHCQIAELVD